MNKWDWFWLATIVIGLTAGAGLPGGIIGALLIFGAFWLDERSERRHKEREDR